MMAIAVVDPLKRQMEKHVKTVQSSTQILERGGREFAPKKPKRDPKWHLRIITLLLFKIMSGMRTIAGVSQRRCAVDRRFAVK